MNNFSAQDDKELKLFYARLCDLEKRAEGGTVAHSGFLTPSESFKAEKYFEAKGKKDEICFFGGYKDAQRKQIFLLPEYIAFSDGKEQMLTEEFEDAVRALKIVGSGFRNLSHRDYLGSILSLGIERSTLGDICPIDESSAIVFCTPEVEDFLLFELNSIGNDKVKVERFQLDSEMTSSQKFQSFTDTVASERLDCVVASIFKLSREKAQNLIRGGFVEHNYETATKPDRGVEQGDIISARGFGKFIVRDISQTTKKGRIRLFADKYI